MVAGHRACRAAGVQMPLFNLCAGHRHMSHNIPSLTGLALPCQNISVFITCPWETFKSGRPWTQAQGLGPRPRALDPGPGGSEGLQEGGKSCSWGIHGGSGEHGGTRTGQGGKEAQAMNPDRLVFVCCGRITRCWRPHSVDNRRVVRGNVRTTR